MVKFINKDTIKAKDRIKILEFSYKGETYTVESKIVNGEMELLEFEKPIGEMITSADTAVELLRKVTLDVDMGREQVQLLYKPIYQTLEDRNFPRVFKAKWMQEGRVIFLQHVEGEEVKFGTLESKEGPIAEIITWAAGFKYTEDMVEYNETFNMDLLNTSMGEAYNALLNDIHFRPFFIATYKKANQTPASTEYDGKADWANIEKRIMNTRQTLIDAVEATRKAKRPGNILLINSANEQRVKDALASREMYGTVYDGVAGIDTIISYDGWDIEGEPIKVGEKYYSYQGCPLDKAYLIRPKKYLKELIKMDLKIDTGNADLSRLIEEIIVGRSRRGVFVGIDKSVQEITLPQ